MSDQRDPNIVATDAGTPPPAAPATSTATPSTPTTAQPSDNSNAPDAQTPAAKTIPANLVNNPQVPSQKLAAQADANKNSDAPHHTMLRKAAEALAGGPMYTTRYDNDGTAIRTPVQPSLAHLGLALALDVLKGGIAGGNQKDSVSAAQAGAKVADKQRQDIKQAEIDQDAQAKADQNHKMAVMTANMQNHQTASLVGKEDESTAKAYSDGYESLAGPLLDGTQVLPDGVSLTEPQFETDAMAAIKNGKTNVTHDFLMPVGDPVPLKDSNGNTVMKDGHAVYGHNYVTVHGADKFQSSLTPDLMQKLQSVGYFTQDGKPAKINPNQPWSFADLAKKTASYASIMAGEKIMQAHKDDAHDILGREQEATGSLADAVKKDPTTRKAVELFSRAAAGAGNDHIEDILHTMMKTDPNSAAIIMDHLGLKPQDLDDIANKRIEAHTEATTKEAQAKPLTPEQKQEIQARTDLLKQEKETSGANKKKIDAETDKLLADKEGQADLSDAIGKGQVTADRLGYILARKPEILQNVLAKYPDFDSTKAGDYPKVSAEFKSTKKNTAGYAINAGATAFKHLAELQTLNTNASRIPGTKDAQHFNDKLDTLASELANFYGNNTIPAIDGYKKTLGATFNRDAAITEQAKSMADKMNSYEHQWYNAAPSAVYQAPIPWMDHDSLAARAQLDPSFKTRVPEGAAGRMKFTNGRTYWVNKANKPIQEVVQ